MFISYFYFPHNPFKTTEYFFLELPGTLFAPALWTTFTSPRDHLLSLHHGLSNAAPDIDTQATGNWYSQEIHIISLR